MLRFAFIIMGDFDSSKDRAEIHNKKAQIIGVSSIEEAEKIAGELVVSGVDCIELCGAFGETGAKRIVNATNGSIPVGYITHLEEQNRLYKEVFGE